VPEQLYDPDFCGIETDCPETCDHNEKLARYVAFEGENTGRRFLGCAKSVSFQSAVYYIISYTVA
jgi:hypothetical protein